MKFEIDGKIHKIFDTEQKSERFRAREFVIEVQDGKFPQMVKFQLTQDRCEAIDNYREGTDVKVHFNLRGREWNGKYFTNLEAWKLENAGAGAGNEPPPFGDDNPYPEMDQSAPKGPNQVASDFDDDIPF